MQKPHGCFFPLNALAVHPQGTRKFCLTSTLPHCESSVEFKNQRLEIHNELLSGEWPESCRSCRKQEEQGLQSRRLRMWQRKIVIYEKSRAEAIINQQVEPVLRHLEISFSNACNLNCAMCSSEFSTGWISGDVEAVRRGFEFRGFTQRYSGLKRLTEEQVAELLFKCQDVDLLIVKGGEPTREPLCLSFLSGLAKLRAENLPSVFLQTNGTRHPREWLPQIGGLSLEVGFSLDGWGRTYEWIRGTSFDRVLEHFLYLEDQDQVSGLSIDFTLSVFNCLHFPEFLEKILELKERVTKLKTCPFFQWAQESYARPDNLELSERMKILNKARLLLEAHPDFFLNYGNIMKVLSLNQCNEVGRREAVRWIEYLNELRSDSLYDIHPSLKGAL